MLAIGLVIAMVPMCVQAPDELSQLLVGVVGAGAFLAWTHYQQKLKVKSKKKKDAPKIPAPGPEAARPVRDASGTSPSSRPARRAHAKRQEAFPQPDVRQESKVPVKPPSFAAPDFDSQAEELVAAITPSQETDNVARKLAERARVAIEQLFPGVDVVGFASGDVMRGTAFGVAVPEIDIVASAPPQVLVDCLSSRLSKGGIKTVTLDARKLQKSAIRACTDQLVACGGFKFRRSCFRAEDPKVTLMASPVAGVSDKAIPVDFSVNCVMPLHNHALVTECGHIEPRAKSLILLVKRWAKDRGICHAAKGHIGPYAWTLLTIYFLQVGIKNCPLLPPCVGFRSVKDLGKKRGKTDESEATATPSVPASEAWAATMTVGELFRAFLEFYAHGVDWRTEAASVRAGRRAAPNLTLKLHIVMHEDQSTEVGPSIEDPFDPTRNLGASLTSIGASRLSEELSRAAGLLKDGASLTDLLTPWMPARGESGQSDGEGAEARTGAE